MRKLTYSADEGGWLAQSGTPQEWEAAYFFPEGAGIDDGQDWPHNLTDEVTDDDLERYRAAREQKDTGSIMDLLSAGSPHSILRLARHLKVDLDQPAARLPAGKNWKLWLIILAVVLVLVGAFVAGALTAPPRPGPQKLEVLEQRNP